MWIRWSDGEVSVASLALFGPTVGGEGSGLPSSGPPHSLSLPPSPASTLSPPEGVCMGCRQQSVLTGLSTYRVGYFKKKIWDSGS